METILMSSAERRRLEVFSQVRAGVMTLSEAGVLLGVSYRHVKRIWSRYQQEGDVGLVHRARGRASNRQSPAGVKEQVLALYREQYADYGPTLAAECLAQENGLTVKVSTLRRWLCEGGLWERCRKRRVHRRRRERRQHLGELVQLDGSHHDWFEGRRPAPVPDVLYPGWAVLMVMIDDATGRVFAQFYENESWHSAADVFQQYVASSGVPRGLYVDQHGIYRADREPTSAEILANQQPETQFGRSMRELNVELILARSPQAKGRVERMNRTLQDRLVKALRRAKISDIESANAFLKKTFLPDLNGRFMVPAAAAEDWHRPLADDTDLARILSIQETRVVQNDWTVRWQNRFMQLPNSGVDTVQPGDRVVVCEQLDSRLRLFRGEQELTWSDTPVVPQRQAKPKQVEGPLKSNQGQKPSADHPWRSFQINTPPPSGEEMARSAPAR